jgi:hypothetical protein
VEGNTAIEADEVAPSESVAPLRPAPVVNGNVIEFPTIAAARVTTM